MMTLPATIMDGRKIAEEIGLGIRSQIDRLKTAGIEPAIALVRIGEGEASESYFRAKIRKAKQLGITATPVELPSTTTADKAASVVRELSSDSRIHGVIVENEVPENIAYEDLVNSIPYWKDVDGASYENLGRLMSGKPCLVAATPLSVMEFVRRCGIQQGSMVAVINRTITVGKPLAMLLLAENYTPVVMHSRTARIREISRQSSAVVVATGHPRFLNADFVTEDSVVIDVGINSVDGKIVGDVDFEPVSAMVRCVTPVPGGVGAVTSTIIFSNLIKGIGMSGILG